MPSLVSIRMFAAAYEERSFTAAALREHATQPGVSQHVKKLEARLGVSLFLRSPGVVEPTPAGHAYYPRCLEVLRAHEAATQAAQALSGGLQGRIVVGLMPTLTRAVLPAALARFSEANPNVAVVVAEAYSAELTDRVRAGELDLAIVPGTGVEPGVRRTRFARTPEVLVVRSNSRGPHLSPLRPAELSPLKLVLPGPGNARRQTIETYLEEHRVVVTRRLELDTMLGTLSFVAATDWAAILPGILMVDDIDGGRLSVHPLIEPAFALDLALIEPARRATTEAAAGFIAELEAQAKRLGAYLASKIDRRARV